MRETAAPSHAVTGMKTIGREARSFTHGWELPGLLGAERGKAIPADTRFKPGSGQWEYGEFLGRACAAVIAPTSGQAARAP